MAVFQNSGDSIEGKTLNVNSRSKIAQGHINIDNIGYCYRFLCKKNANAKIEKELEDKENLYSEKSHLALNDEVRGDAVELYSKNNIRFSVSANYSSKHGIQTGIANPYGCAQVRRPFHFILTASSCKQIE